MARTSDPNSANSQFFICLAPATFLDGNYTLVGQVTAGMDAVEKIKPGAGQNGTVSNPEFDRQNDPRGIKTALLY